MIRNWSDARFQRRHAARASYVFVLLLAGGCTVNPPSPEEIREQSLGDLNIDHPWKAVAASTDSVQDNWLSSFQDPQLDALVKEALVRNPDLRIAAARVEQSGQYLQVAKAALRPWLQIAGTGGTKSSGGGDTSSALQGIGISASWELDLWGRVRYARNAAQESYVSAQSDFEFARQSLAAATARA